MDNLTFPQNPPEKGYRHRKGESSRLIGPSRGANEPDVDSCLKFLDHAAECVARKTAEY